MANTITKTTRIAGEWDPQFLPAIVEIQQFIQLLLDAGVDPGTRFTEISNLRAVVEWPVEPVKA